MVIFEARFLLDAYYGLKKDTSLALKSDIRTLLPI